MHAVAVLQKHLRCSIPAIHLKRLSAVMAIVGGALHGGRLTLSGLGRSLEAPCAVRHRIKRVDRLLGNAQLHEERGLFYRALCELVVGSNPHPLLIVDWSDLKPDRSWQLLRAAVWVHGFALPIYEEVHPLRRLGSRKVQREFLGLLRSLLPDHVRPIVVTDAGFRSPWFQAVEKIGWHWVGRIRNRTEIEIDGRWIRCKTLHAMATARPLDLGEHAVTKTNPIKARVVLYRKARQGRHHLTAARKVCRRSDSRKHAAREKEPWLLVASSSLSRKTTLELVQIYRLRWRIEHGFRTLKSHQFGFSFEDSRTRQAERIATLLLIHALALFLAWIAGWAAQRNNLHRRLWSNAIDDRATLSIITLGCLALNMLQLQMTVDDFKTALERPPLLHEPIQRTPK